MTSLLQYKSGYVGLLLGLIALANWSIGEVVSQENILCNLPKLGHSGYVSEQGLIFYWNLCPENGIKLEQLSPKCAPGGGNDGGDVCVKKVTSK